MLFSMHARRGGIICGFALVLVLLIGPACQLLPENPSRLLGERFMHSVAAQSEVPADFYLAPDAEVFLQGAPSSLSRAGFRDYVAVMNRGRCEYQAGSRIFATPGGAGWLLRISQLPDPTALYQPDASDLPPQLWMEVSIKDDQITRLWIHFTIEALPGLGINSDAYRHTVALRGIPVPDGWSEGTPALLAAAARVDRRAGGDWTDSGGHLLMLMLGLLALGLSGLAARARWRSRPQDVARLHQGGLLAKLRDARSVGSSQG